MRIPRVLLVASILGCSLGLVVAEFSKTPSAPSPQPKEEYSSDAAIAPPLFPSDPDPLPVPDFSRKHEAPSQLHLDELKEGQAVCWHAPGTSFGVLPATFKKFITTRGGETMVLLVSINPQWSEVLAFPVALGLVPRIDGTWENSWLTPALCGTIA